MTDPHKINYYNDKNVGSEVRRLAFCFNLAAETYLDRDAGLLLRKGKEMFTATTGKESLPQLLNDDEISFMRLQFLKLAAKQQGKQDPGWNPYSNALFEKAEVLEQAAEKIGLSFKNDLL